MFVEVKSTMIEVRGLCIDLAQRGARGSILNFEKKSEISEISLVTKNSCVCLCVMELHYCYNHFIF